MLSWWHGGIMVAWWRGDGGDGMMAQAGALGYVLDWRGTPRRLDAQQRLHVTMATVAAQAGAQCAAVIQFCLHSSRVKNAVARTQLPPCLQTHLRVIIPFPR